MAMTISEYRRQRQQSQQGGGSFWRNVGSLAPAVGSGLFQGLRDEIDRRRKQSFVQRMGQAAKDTTAPARLLKDAFFSAPARWAGGAMLEAQGRETMDTSSPVGKFIFGQDKLKSLGKTKREASGTLQKLGMKEGTAETITPLAMVGFATLDILPGGKLFKPGRKVAREIEKKIGESMAKKVRKSFIKEVNSVISSREFKLLAPPEQEGKIARVIGERVTKEVERKIVAESGLNIGKAQREAISEALYNISYSARTGNKTLKAEAGEIRKLIDEAVESAPKSTNEILDKIFPNRLKISTVATKEGVQTVPQIVKQKIEKTIIGETKKTFREKFAKEMSRLGYDEYLPYVDDSLDTIYDLEYNKARKAMGEGFPVSELDVAIKTGKIKKPPKPGSFKAMLKDQSGAHKIPGIDNKPKKPLQEGGKTYYHGTTKQGAASIEKEGFKFGKGATGQEHPITKSLVGDVVYFSENSNTAKAFARTGFKEDAALVKRDLSNLKLAKPSDAIGGTLKAENTKLGRAKIDDLKARGFDGLKTGKDDIAVWNIDKIKPLQEGGKVTKAKKVTSKDVRKFTGEQPKATRTRQERVLVKQKLKEQAKGARAGSAARAKKIKEAARQKREVKKLTKDIVDATKKNVRKEQKAIVKQIQAQRRGKNLSDNTYKRLKNQLGIKETKNATKEQLKEFLSRISELKKGDKFLSKKQATGLESVMEKGDTLLTVREIKEKYGIGDVLSKYGVQYVSPILRFKEKHATIKKVVDAVQGNEQLMIARKHAIDNQFKGKLKAAYRSRGMFSKKTVWKNIFDDLSGKNVALTEQEKEVSRYMKDYFAKAKTYLIEHGDMAKGRKKYVPHLQKELAELISDHGLLKGIKKYKNWKIDVKKEGDIPADLWVALDDIMGTNKFFKFALERKGGVEPTKNIEKIFNQYMQLFEAKTFLDESLPKLHGVATVLMEGRGQKFLTDFGQQLKGRGIDYALRKRFNMESKVADRIVDTQYLLKLGFRNMSAMVNLVGGEVNSFIYNPFHRYLLGKKRLLLNPVKSYKTLKRYGFMDGDYVALAETSLPGKVANVFNKTAFIQQKMAEYEIRGAEVMGLLTRAEFKTGKLSKKRMVEIMDVLEETQGVFTPSRTPLAANTMVGRSAMQFSRWIITDTSMIKKITIGAFKGSEKLKNQKRLAKALSAFIVGGYLANEYSKKGDKNAQRFAETLQEPIRITLQTLSGITALNMVTSNPTIQMLKEAKYSLELVGYKMGISDFPQKIEMRQGLQDTYIGGVRELQEAGLVDAEGAYLTYVQLKRMKPAEANKKFREIEKEDAYKATRIRKYIKWDKLKLSDKEREFSYMGVKDGQRAKAIYKHLKRMKPAEANKTYKRLRKAGIVSNTVAKQVKILIKNSNES